MDTPSLVDSQLPMNQVQHALDFGASFDPIEGKGCLL